LTIEFTTMAPIILATLVLLWQMALTGYAFVLSGNIADKAVRAAATADPGSRNAVCNRAGRENLPGGWTATISCPTDGDMVEAKVGVRVPVLFPGGWNFPLTITSKSAAARER